MTMTSKIFYIEVQKIFFKNEITFTNLEIMWHNKEAKEGWNKGTKTIRIKSQFGKWNLFLPL